MSRRKIWLICGAAVLVVGIGLSVVGYWVATQRVGDVRNGDKVPFLSLPDETVLYSGHGPATRVGRERLRNPFVQEWLQGRPEVRSS